MKAAGWALLFLVTLPSSGQAAGRGHFGGTLKIAFTRAAEAEPLLADDPAQATRASVTAFMNANHSGSAALPPVSPFPKGS